MKNLKINPTYWTKFLQMDIVWFILISSWVCSCFLFWRSHLDLAHHQFFWEHWAPLPIEAPLSQNKNKCAPYDPPFQFIYMRLELWAHHTGYNLGVIGNVLGNNLGTCGTFWGFDENLMRTWWEHIGNKIKQKNSRVVILFVFKYLTIILSYLATLAIKITKWMNAQNDLKLIVWKARNEWTKTSVWITKHNIMV
jgi:hypothetical protein